MDLNIEDLTSVGLLQWEYELRNSFLTYKCIFLILHDGNRYISLTCIPYATFKVTNELLRLKLGKISEARENQHWLGDPAHARKIKQPLNMNQ